MKESPLSRTEIEAIARAPLPPIRDSIPAKSWGGSTLREWQLDIPYGRRPGRAPQATRDGWEMD